MFKTRLISGIVLVILALAVIITGGPLLYGVTLIISLIGMHELYRAAGVEDKGAFSPLACAGYLGAVLYYAAILIPGFEKFNLMAVTGGVIAVMAVYVFTYPRYVSNQVMTACTGIVYVAVMLSCIYLTRQLPKGAFTVWLIFICSWGCDTCAYCAGMLLGKHKMAPILSPKKSVEGAVGGVIGAVLLGIIYAAVTGRYTGQAPIWEYALISGVGALISMVGDLAASAVKRNHDIKDYGNLIPGHGGILDRFDSVIFTAPVIYTLALILVH